EFTLQKQVCTYLRVQHKDVLFMSDTIASVKRTEAQATRNASIQKRGFKTPDLIIFAPRGIYHGLFIELKTKTPYKKDGTLLENAHLKAQEETIKNLRNLGYYADFKWELEEVIKLIDWYLKLDGNEV
ncbi:MAG: hypothetical protein WCJ72_19680, partial [Chryseobacterium sp.]